MKLTSTRQGIVRACSLLAVVLCFGGTGAATIGMVADNATSSVIVFDADTDKVLGSVQVGSGGIVGDCSITPDQTLGFVTDFLGHLWVIDLAATPPTLATGVNPIPISNPGEDTSITPDGRFIVVCDGLETAPISVVDVEARVEVETFALPGGSCHAVEVCGDGRVLAASFSNNRMYRLNIDAAGQLSHTGVSVATYTINNLVCSPDTRFAMISGYYGDWIKTLSMPGLAEVNTLSSGGTTVSGLIDHFWGYAVIRTLPGGLGIYKYDTETGVVGPKLVLRPLSGAVNLIGIEQMALHPDGTKAYISLDDGVGVFTTLNYIQLRSITDPSIVRPTGICFANPPDIDSDGLPSYSDNCPTVLNPDQFDFDEDGLGDACDNCPFLSNDAQFDRDNDRIGDDCDECIDIDSDGAGSGRAHETCPRDNCYSIPNPDQADVIHPGGAGDACDDPDDDDVYDREDNCPDDPNPEQEDFDSDGRGDSCDPDADGDAIEDGIDNCLFISNTGQEDADGDGPGDACDNCATVPNAGSINLEGLLARVNAGGVAIADLVPDRFDFTGGEYGSSIADGGQDMYDYGNRLKTSLNNTISYTNGAISDRYWLFGGDSRYFTAKYPGLFVLAAENISIDYFEISGYNGADGEGFVDGVILNALGGVYTVYVKRVFGAANPSINHIIIVPGSGEGITHTFPTYTDYDLHTVEGLGSVRDLYYLLVARQNGEYLANADILNISEEFLSHLGQQDRDGDGIGDVCDSCPEVFNPEQSEPDGDGDGFADVCDICPLDPANDRDGDDLCAEIDNCPAEFNPGQEDDIHPNGIGDACDDPDQDGLSDNTDNCPDVSNTDQADLIHPNGIGDACDDPDQDGVFDSADNCPDESNSAQEDYDLDMVGDACDICSEIPNPGQTEAVACIEVTENGGQCLESHIQLTGRATSGEVQILQPQETTPESLTFRILATTCGPPDDLKLTLNGTSVGVVVLDPEIHCSCSTPIQELTVSDTELLHAVWNPAGDNLFNIAKIGEGSLLSWVLVDINGTTGSNTACLYDHEGGSCSVENLCSAGYTYTLPGYDSIATDPLVDLAGVSVGFAQSQLPGLVNIGELFDGPISLCVTGDDHGADCVAALKQGEEDLAVNGAACGPPTAEAGGDQLLECVSHSGAAIALDGSGSTDPNSTPGTNDDIVLFEWFEDHGLPSETLLGSGEILQQILPVGFHTITLIVTDSFGEADSDQLFVSVIDTTAPEIAVSLDPILLWPPNHRMVDIVASVVATDACSIPAITLEEPILSSEPDDAPGMGDGSTVNDIQGVEYGAADFLFGLRAERAGSGEGRIYTVTYSATDPSGNGTSASAVVFVPHNMNVRVQPESVGQSDEGAQAVSFGGGAETDIDVSPRGTGSGEKRGEGRSPKRRSGER